MKIQLDDARLTAYALGEMDAEERADFEKLLEHDEDARAEVENIRSACAVLSTELLKEPAGALTDEQRQAIASATESGRKGRQTDSFRARRGWFGTLVKVAAVVLFVGVGLALILPDMARVRESARISSQENDRKIAEMERKMAQNEASAPAPKADATPAPSVIAPTPPPAPQESAKKADAIKAEKPKLSRQARESLEGLGYLGKNAASAPATPTPPASPSPPSAARALAEESHGRKQNVDGSAPEGTVLHFGKVLPPGVLSGSAPAAAPPPPPSVYGSAGPSSGPSAPAQKSVEMKEQLQAQGYIGGNANARSAPVYSYDVNGNEPSPERRPSFRGTPKDIRFQYQPRPAPDTEAYAQFIENRYQAVGDQPLSTFGVDVDTASYSNIRRFLNEGTLPPADAVRIEEMVNYFKYDYPQPEGGSPFAVHVEVQPCPWRTDNLLARIGIKGKSVDMSERQPCNLVFLLDTSGSMADQDKLPLLVKGMKVLANELSGRDRVAIVTYSDSPRVMLDSVSCEEKGRIGAVLDQLSASGSTNGAGGIEMAYDVARRYFITGGVNRVVLATDGDFNVGMTATDSLSQMVQQQAKSGIFFTVLGFGKGNLKDTNLQAMADKGNGQYYYVDSFKEARRVLMDGVAGTLITIAKDVKIQVEFNPTKIGAYRLIGYEKRALAARDFNDDTKDAGEIGAGHTVTALYELVPAGKPLPPTSNVDPLKYQGQPPAASPPPPGNETPELMTVKLRFKTPDANTSTKFDLPVVKTESAPSPDFKFAAGVAAFGMLLRNSEFKEEATLDLVAGLAEQGKGNDPEGARTEFIDLVKTASALVR